MSEAEQTVGQKRRRDIGKERNVDVVGENKSIAALHLNKGFFLLQGPGWEYEGIQSLSKTLNPTFLLMGRPVQCMAAPPPSVYECVCKWVNVRQNCKVLCPLR